MTISFARLRFYQALQLPEINLAETALYIAQEEYPQLDVASYLQSLEQMAEQVKAQLPAERYPLRILQTINCYLYDQLGFRGNSLEYYDPRNSYLNQVLDRRTGIPITLSLVYLEIARHLDFPMVGVGFPGHFLIRPDLPEIEIHIDAFNQGEMLFAEDCQERLQQIFGPEVELDDRFFLPVNNRQILLRILTNLKNIYLDRGEASKCLAAIERILAITPDASQELRDRGLLYYQMGQWVEARQDLLAYLEANPDLEDKTMIQDLLNRMKED